MNLLVEACLGGSPGNQPQVPSPEMAGRGTWRCGYRSSYSFSTNAVDGSVSGIWACSDKNQQGPRPSWGKGSWQEAGTSKEGICQSV